MRIALPAHRPSVSQLSVSLLLISTIQAALPSRGVGICTGGRKVLPRLKRIAIRIRNTSYSCGFQ